MRAALVATAALALAAAAGPAAAEVWDMPMAYADGNFHTQNGKLFAQCVKTGTGGKLEIVVHGGGSLFKGNEIKRAVQTGQVPIGERLLSAHQNENAVFGYDSVPFLATSYEDSEKLWQAARPIIEKVLEQQNLVLLYSVPWPPQGIYTKKPLESIEDMKGQVPRLQHRYRAAGGTDGRPAGADRGGGTGPGAGHRRGRVLHLLWRHRL